MSKTQNAFVASRQILDALVANECVDYRLVTGVPRVMFKLVRAANWNFLILGRKKRVLGSLGEN